MSVSFKPTSGKMPKLFLKRKSPWSFMKRNRRVDSQYRILLAIDQEPPGFDRGRVRMKTIDSPNRYIFGELEHLVTSNAALETCGNSSKVPVLPRRGIGKTLDLDLPRKWLANCESHRHPDPKDHLFRGGNGFRLIDVVEKCLVEMTEPCEYVALSYVWGNIADSVRTTKQTIIDFKLPQSLSVGFTSKKGLGHIPRTILDAMTVVHRLGLRYLWVDSLCIVQDDPDEKQRLIHGMNSVYQNAKMTVIAAAGTDSDAGLPGISLRKDQPCGRVSTLNIDGTALQVSIARPSLVTQVRNSYWNTRGWTYQEQYLSERCLSFTPTEVFFSCREKQWREGYDLESLESLSRTVRIWNGPPCWKMSIKQDKDPSPYRHLDHKPTVKDYSQTVQEYSRRELSYSNDILNAFEGVYSLFTADLPKVFIVPIGVAQAIPPIFLPESLFWKPLDGSTQSNSGDFTESLKLSTWSWTSQISPVEFPHLNNTSWRSLWRRVVSTWYLGLSDQRFQTIETGRKFYGPVSGSSPFYLDSKETLSGIPDDLDPVEGELAFWAPYASSGFFQVIIGTERQQKME